MKCLRSRVFLVLALFLTGCSVNQPQGEKEVYRSYQQAINKIAVSMNEYIHQEVESHRLPLVLDLYVEGFYEKPTNNQISFSEKLRKDFSISLNQSRKDLLATLENNKADIIFQLSDQILHKSFILSGHFQQLDERWVKVTLELSQVADKKVLTAYEACFPMKDIQEDYQKDFSSGVEKRFQAFKKHLANIQLMQVVNFLEREWDPLYTKEQSQEALKLIEQKVGKAVEIIRKPIWNYRDIEAKLAIADYLLKKVLVFEKISLTIDLNPNTIKEVKTIRSQLIAMKSLPKKGLRTTLSFVAESSSNTPLEFQCSGIIHNKSVDLTVGKRNFVAKLGHCSTEDEKQIISWKKIYKLVSHENLSVWATERNMLSRDITVSGYLSVSPDDLLELYQKGVKSFSVKGTEYSIRFYKK